MVVPMETPLLSPATGKSENGHQGKCTVNSAVQRPCKAGDDSTITAS